MADKKGRFKYTEPTEYFPDSIMKNTKSESMPPNQKKRNL